MKTRKEKAIEAQYDFNIDYDMFNTDEIIKIYSFFGLIQKNEKKPVPKKELLAAYNEYRNILNNKTLEKQYDKKFEKATGISIYHTINNLQ